MQYNEEVSLAIELARQAGEIAIEIHDREYDVALKSGDRGPVTEADRRINEFLVQRVSQAFPDDTVLGEETKAAVDLNADRLWIIDPIDGTKDFLKKNGEWSIMIGFTVGGSAKVGVVYQPSVGKLYSAVEGQGAWVERAGVSRRLHVSRDADSRHATIVNSRSHPDDRIDRIQQRLGVRVGYRHGSVGCKLAHIAEARADMYFNLSGRCGMWDTCGPEVIIREAGGDLTDLDGHPLHYGGESTLVDVPFVATTDALKPAVLAAWAELREELSE